jgi:AcrR family transcriptional regulator
MPRPRAFTTNDLASAALAVVERDGLGALSMRAVAEQLGVAPMALYRYVDSRDELEGLVVDLVLGGVDPDVPARWSWDKRVTSLVVRVRDAIGAHPAIVPLLLTRRHVNEASRQWGEAMMAALADGGFTGPDRAIAFRTLLSYLFGAVQVEHFGPLAGPGTTALAALPADRYPHLAETAKHARRITPDTEFRRGLAVVLDGLAAGAASPRRR